MDENLSYLGITPHLKNLRFCGYYQLDSSSKKIKLLHAAYMRIILCLILLFTGQQIAKVYQVRGDINKIINIMFLLLTNSDAIYKQVVLWWKAHRIEELLTIMRGSIFNQRKPEHREFLLLAARESKILLRSFNYAALFTCLLWFLYPVILHFQRKPTEFEIWLPFDTNISPQFYFAALYVWLQTSWLAYSNTTMDVFITFFLVQCKTQLSILRLDLEHIVEKSKEGTKGSVLTFESNLDWNLKKVLLHYHEIIKFSGMFQDTFGGVILYQFLVSAWIICTTAYETLNIDSLLSVECMSMIMYMGCVLTQLFLYCFYGNEVTLESEKLRESLYSIDWTELPLKYQRAIIIFMERVKRAINPVAGSLIPLSNSTFVSVLRSSYTFFTFLKNTN